MVGAANSDPARISFLGSTEGGLAQKLDRGSRRSPFEAVYSSALRTARNGRLLHGSLTLPALGLGTYYSSVGGAVRRRTQGLGLLRGLPYGGRHFIQSGTGPPA